MILKYRIISILLILVALALGFFHYASENDPDSIFGEFPFKLGLDLAGGSHLVYSADVSDISEDEVDEAMRALRDVIERRVNVFGVSEPIVQVERGGVFGGGDERLIVELPGVTDIDEAIEMIGQTPNLEFMFFSDDSKGLSQTIEGTIDEDGNLVIGDSEGISLEDIFVSTGLTGRLIQRAQLEFDPISREPYVSLRFNSDGRELFAEITRNNIGEILAIVLDGEPISTPVIREEIPDGVAVISGGFNAQEARELVRNINLGALPVPIELVSTQTVGASLGHDVVDKGVFAGATGLLLVALFLIIWYRLPGLVAVVSLSIYVLIMLALFKLIPVTLTAAGIAGFILSVGMAVDANILIFERMKEEFRLGKSISDAINEGFARAWLSIRDGNISSIITAIVLFYLGTSMVQGFALTFGIGVLVSMITAISITRIFLVALGNGRSEGVKRFLFGSGIKRNI